MHFLEHVDDAATVFRIIERAVTATRDFLFVRQPYFDHDPALAALGCKTYWSDWSGHKTKLTRDMVAELSGRLGDTGISCEISVYAIDRIDNTGHSAILPLGVPPDQHAYDPERHGAKPITVVDFECFRDILVIFARHTATGVGHQRMKQLMATFGSRTTLLGEYRVDRRRVVNG
jgi:hypothetical protein